MMPKIFFERAQPGYITFTISEDAVSEVLQAVARQSYSEGYEDGQADNIKAD